MIIEKPRNTPEAWSQRAETYAEPWTACGWSQESQETRFERVLWALDPKPGERLLDFGCGTGELTEWLSATVDYTGYDTAAGMLLRAASDHPSPHRTFTPIFPHHRYELVACIGTFNLKDHWTAQDTWHIIRHLWDRTDCRALAACLYAGADKACLHYTPDELEQCGRTLSHNYRVEETLPNDLMLVVER